MKLSFDNEQRVIAQNPGHVGPVENYKPIETFASYDSDEVAAAQLSRRFSRVDLLIDRPEDNRE